jgi:hypothetical protein
LEGAILLEANWDSVLCDEVWCAFAGGGGGSESPGTGDANSELVRRICIRDGLDEAAAQARIDSQMGLRDRLLRSDVAICTQWDVHETRRQVDAAMGDVMDLLVGRPKEVPPSLD